MNYISRFVRLLLICLLLICVAVVFYWLQNSGQLLGGKIALPKLFWLVYAIVLWFLIPGFLVKRKQTPRHWRTVFGWFLINMLLRGVVELYLMYVTVNWSPYYGIAHDLFSIVVLGWLLVFVRHNIHMDCYLGYAAVLITTLMIESVFVMYMINAVSADGHRVYFVPDDASHSVILSFTWVVVLLLSVYLVDFGRRVLSERFDCRGFEAE